MTDPVLNLEIVLLYWYGVLLNMKLLKSIIGVTQDWSVQFKIYLSNENKRDINNGSQISIYCSNKCPQELEVYLVLKITIV